LLGKKKKRPRKNRFKKGPKTRRSGPQTGKRGLLATKLLGVVLVCATLSASYVIIYEYFTQSDYFAVKKISVSGNQRLQSLEVVRQAGLFPGMNLLKLNLSVTRRMLLTHAWIESALVAREVPDKLHIQIVEQHPVAILDLGKRYLINAKGRIFKQWEPADPEELPLVTGLRLTDISLTGESPSRLFEAVMEVITLGREPQAVLPNAEIRIIQADPEIGLTLIAFDSAKMIRLGYGQYADKYEKLTQLLTTLREGDIIRDYDRIDLNDINRIVVAPSGDESQSLSGKEVKFARTG
jgi:cell division protein FtsQ